jgi:hypothetical protein
MYALGEVRTDDPFLLQQMHALAISIGQAKDRGDKAAVIALRNRFEQLAAQFRANGGTEGLSAVDNFILAVDQWIQTSVDAIPGAIAALPVAVGKGLIMAAIPFAVLALGFLYFKDRTLRR